MNKQEIDNALNSHSLWKMRLKTAIATGKLEIPVEQIQADDQCAFGKWLYGPTISAQEKESAQYKTIQVLHAEFHLVAGRTALLVTEGREGDAGKMMASGGEFAAISDKLSAALVAWKESIPG